MTSNGPVPPPKTLVGLLADHGRLRAFAAVVLGARNLDEVAERTGLSQRELVTAVRRLTGAGLLAVGPAATLVARVDVFAQSVRAPEPGPPGGNGPESGGGESDPDRAAILRTFVSAGRLVTIPAARAKRRVILEHIAAAFEPGVRYPEREVNAVLRAWHPDHAALRRYLVDELLMARDHGEYWRIGGPVEFS